MHSKVYIRSVFHDVMSPPASGQFSAPPLLTPHKPRALRPLCSNCHFVPFAIFSNQCTHPPHITLSQTSDSLPCTHAPLLFTYNYIPGHHPCRGSAICPSPAYFPRKCRRAGQMQVNTPLHSQILYPAFGRPFTTTNICLRSFFCPVTTRVGAALACPSPAHPPP